MRILILGANLAGLLSAQQMRRQGHEVCVLVHGTEATHQAAPPMVFTDPGPWGAPQGALATLSALLRDQGDLRLGPDGLGHLGWLLRCLGQRCGSGARSQALRALAMARRSKLALDELQGREHGLPTPQALAMLSVHRHAGPAQQHQHRGPMWHLGTRPTLAPLSAEAATLPAHDAAWGQTACALKSEGLMLADSAAVLADLRQQLALEGVRFVYDQTVDGAVHTGQHLHSVTLRGTLNQADEIDCDWVIATSWPAAQPLLKALGLKPDLAPMTQVGLHIQLPETAGPPLCLHDQPSGVRLMRQGQRLWAQGPLWLGEPEGPLTQEVAHLSAAVTRYFGPAWSLVADQALVQTSWVAPDGLPLVSRTSTRNLLLNLGHHSATPHLAFGATLLLRTLMDTRASARRATATSTPWSPQAASLATSAQGSHHD
ncbi:FAD-dependent oxidoreductase [Ideonella paludis]|uniref:FAD dependent oxidoreductase domain-containing protein n=1 Tax=Ideonella paludis TaxID=1233411 RepID=A0ABS5E0Z1_9BURK|nr:FAD-dependent oxidoreductase [Ideonella paludis]MBQ0937052.1 hypothetical protein [Ideonella paludis]